MRTTGTRLLGGSLGICMAVGLASAANLVATSTTSLQDIVDLTGARTGEQNRWLAHLVEVPRGSEFTQSSLEEEARRSGISLTMAVQTVEAVQVLEHGLVLETGRKQTINRALKGDRVAKPKREGLSIASMQSLTDAQPLVTGSLGDAPRSSLLAAAGAFRTTLPAVYSPSESIAPFALAALDEADLAPAAVPVALNERDLAPDLTLANLDESQLTPAVPVSLNARDLEKTVQGRIPLESDQMIQVRAVAKMMSKALDLAKEQRAKAESLTDVPETTTAYAPSIDPQKSAMASAFAAILRPSVTRRSDGSVKIRLAKGDHKWADDPLPKYSYSKAERHCLANGIYFEARGEPVLGQQAVAQVILNRVRNPAYPNTVCGVVYQNKQKKNACQFSFACDGIRDKVNSRKHWKQSVKVANDAIDGRFWLKSVGSASHYHADYVWPKWRRKMRKMTKIGRHIFYRTFGGGWS